MEVAYFSVTHLTLSYVVPSLVIISCYAMVDHCIRKRKILGAVPLDALQRHIPALRRSKLRSMRTIAIVVAAFACADWLPFYAITFTYILKK